MLKKVTFKVLFQSIEQDAFTTLRPRNVPTFGP